MYKFKQLTITIPPTTGPGYVFASLAENTSFCYDAVLYVLSEDRQSYVCIGPAPELSVPVNLRILGTVNNKPVTAIEESAFDRCTSIESVVIPDSVITIKYHAFYECNALENLTIGNNVTTIGDSAFFNCASVKDLYIPNKVTTIESYAFSGMTRVQSVRIPDSVTYIGPGAFFWDYKLTSVYIPDSVTYVGENAFQNCSDSIQIYCEAKAQPNGWSSYWSNGVTAGNIHWGTAM